MTGDELFAAIKAGLGPEAHRHLGIDAPARRDTAIAGGSYRAPGTLVDGFRAGDADTAVKGVVVAARASTSVLQKAVELGANIVISRQAFLDDSQDRPVARPEHALAEKLAFIETNRLAVLRLQDPRIGVQGMAVTCALPHAIGLESARPDLNPADGLVFATAPLPLVPLIRKIKTALGTTTVRLVGNPELAVRGIALATETNRPNALAPLLARQDVELLIAGEVHETETTAYVMDAIAMGMRKALLLVGSICLEEPCAKRLADWLKVITKAPVTYVRSHEGLTEVF